MWGFDHIKQELGVLKGAPFAAGLLIIVGFSGGMFWRGQEIANLEGLVRLKDGELDDYRKRINERLDNVEKQLSSRQVSGLSEALKSVPSSSIEISSRPNDPVAKQLVRTFEERGWTVSPLPSADRPGVLLRAGGKDAKAIDGALNDAGVNFTTSGKNAGSPVEFSILPNSP